MLSAQELGACISRGDIKGVGTFMRHQPLFTAVLMAPVVVTAAATRHPAPVLAVARVFAVYWPYIRFMPVIGFVPAMATHGLMSVFAGSGIDDAVWQMIVRRAKARNERRSRVRLPAGEKAD